MARDKALFGPAGNCDDFHAAGYKHTVQMFPWIAQHGLTAYEYQCGRGVRLSASSAASIRAEAEKYGVPGEGRVEKLGADGSYTVMIGEEAEIPAGTYRLSYGTVNGEQISEGYVYLNYNQQ